MKKNTIELSKESKADLIPSIKEYLCDEFDIEISDFKAEMFIDFIKNNIATEFYNKGIEDTRIYLKKRMEDIDVDIEQLEIH